MKHIVNPKPIKNIVGKFSFTSNLFKPKLYSIYYSNKYFSSENIAKIESNEEIPSEKLVNFKFVYLNNNVEIPVQAAVGDTILQIAKKYDLSIEGACDASLSCSTCHVILEKKVYDNCKRPKEEEEDLLDLAFGLTSTSRLGCQIPINKTFEGTTIFIPSGTKNLQNNKK